MGSHAELDEADRAFWDAAGPAARFIASIELSLTAWSLRHPDEPVPRFGRDAFGVRKRRGAVPGDRRSRGVAARTPRTTTDLDLWLDAAPEKSSAPVRPCCASACLQHRGRAAGGTSGRDSSGWGGSPLASISYKPSRVSIRDGLATTGRGSNRRRAHRLHRAGRPNRRSTQRLDALKISAMSARWSVLMRIQPPPSRSDSQSVRRPLRESGRCFVRRELCKAHADWASARVVNLSRPRIERTGASSSKSITRIKRQAEPSIQSARPLNVQAPHRSINARIERSGAASIQSMRALKFQSADDYCTSARTGRSFSQWRAVSI